MEHFENTLQHVMAELERIDLLIAAQVARARRLYQKDEQFRGLYISEAEVDELLARPFGRPRWAVSEVERDDMGERLERITRTNRQRAQESLNRGTELRLRTLAQRFQLSPFEVDVLLVSLAMELDLRYERLYAYLQDDVTRKRPSVDLALNLLTATPETRVAAMACFSANAPLLRHRLIDLVDDTAQPFPPLLARYLKIEDRVVQYVMGRDEPDSRIQGFTKMADTGESMDMLLVNQDLRQRMVRFVRNSGDAGGTIIFMAGPDGAGRQSTAAAVCRESGIRMMVVDLEAMEDSQTLSHDAGIALVHREARLQHAAVYWRGFDRMPDEKRKASRLAFAHHLEDRPPITFLAGDQVWIPDHGLKNLPFSHIVFERHDFSERVKIWDSTLRGKGSGITENNLLELASKFKLTGGQILDAAAAARHMSLQKSGEPDQFDMEDLYDACYRHSSRGLAKLARKITPKYKWTDIILPKDHIDQLREICNQVNHREKVYGQWGFEGKLSLGKSISALFEGPSGTGKTMAAEIIAGELHLELYKIDLSSIVSKYIGETEKNLSTIFTEAEMSNAILFFDEADALFGKRSEVKDSHDRYANIETGYLLQRMEEYEGVVILSTNLRKNMDEAFTRRIGYIVTFPFPNKEARQQIWSTIWPAQTPLGTNLDYEVLADEFEITGGNIKNIVLRAAFMAASDNQNVGRRHLLRATRREYQKMGKVLADGQFALNGDIQSIEQSP
jgi:SpoVK/Ycf46/Vps4 family AAA+-type ATPase